MADFEEFLIAEFNEQHNNMRQIETSLTQIIQVFFSIEGIILAGAISLLSFNATLDQIVTIMAPIFLFLSLFGHLTYRITIYSFINILVIDFQNTVARKYFGKKYGKEEYLYFMLNPEVNSGGKQGDWEKIKDNRSAIARFVGTVNALNLFMFIVAAISILAKLANPQLSLVKIFAANLLLTILILITVFVVIERIYHRMMFLRLVRRDEQSALQRRHDLLKKISREKLSAKSNLRKV